MELRFVEVGNGFNWGKFAVGRHTAEEWARPAVTPGAREASLLAGRGWQQRRHIWVLDLQTGEGAMFSPGGWAKADLDRHQIWVCPMYEPFLTWLYGHIAEHGAPWWDELPPLVDLPGADGAIHGYRRPGAAVTRPRLMSPAEFTAWAKAKGNRTEWDNGVG